MLVLGPYILPATASGFGVWLRCGPSVWAFGVRLVRKLIERVLLNDEGYLALGRSFIRFSDNEIVKNRNRLEKSLGKEDYYDYTIQNAEGFDKARLFEILDDLEVSSRPLMEIARKELAKRHGADALLPYNMGYMMVGDGLVLSIF